MEIYNSENIELTEIELYFKYDYLDTYDLKEILNRIDRLYKNFLPLTYPIYFSEKYDLAFRNFLEIESINTGQSIKIKFKEGWKPEFRIKKKNLIVGIPIKLGIPALAVYFLFIGAQNVMTIRNEYLDAELKKMEIQLKQMEIYDKLKERKALEGNRVERHFQRQANDVINFIIQNKNINYVEINGTTIKNDE
ncbi:hypothetical protein K8089_10075 [Aequorivita sp. F47161]|uniref:Uncharacterized protein n=1 Tax=Aequorivita vitellina TaxID=2874475 RepID=A0A9X1QW22_9FLAO|nr:hypothetical protein [Aequorivita vitellina]MCG2419370.1 hypothetical protein [Aequorivita vitellina]